MIANDLYFISITILPDKAYAILIIDPDAVLSQPAPLKRFQSIARKNGNIGECLGSMNLNKLSFDDIGQPIESFGRKPLENQLSIFGSKRSNHSCNIVRDTSYIKKWIIRQYAINEIEQVTNKGKCLLQPSLITMVS